MSGSSFAAIYVASLRICDAADRGVDLSILQSLVRSGAIDGVYPTVYGTVNVQIPCAGLERGSFCALIFSIGIVVIPVLASPSEATIATDELARWLSTVLGKSVKARDVETTLV